MVLADLEDQIPPRLPLSKKIAKGLRNAAAIPLSPPARAVLRKSNTYKPTTAPQKRR
jgi:hypothetical protein